MPDVCENSHLAGTQFRSGMVYVGSETDIIHTLAKAEEIDDIHPFCDGNGRTARIMTQSFLLHHGIEKIKYLPLSRTINDNLSGYYATRKNIYILK